MERRARRLPDRPALVAAICALASVLFVAALLLRGGGDPSKLVHAAPPWTDARAAPGSLTVQAADKGFDGQFFYRIAVSPLSTRRTVAGVRFDLPALRNDRWLYGAVGWAGSGGDQDVVPWALIGINVAAAAAVGGLAGALARDGGRHAAWGLVLALYPGFTYSLSLDTSELVAATFLLAGLLAFRRRRFALGALAFTLAVLTRDTAVVVPAGLAAAALWSRWRAPRSDAKRLLTAAAVPIAGFAAWQIVQRARFGALPLTSSSDNNLTAPFAGLLHELGRSVPPSGGTEAFRLLSALVLLGVIGAAVIAMRGSATPSAEKIAWVPAVVVVALLNSYLWSGATAFMRAGTEAFLLSGLVLLGNRRRWTGLVAVPVGGLWLLTMAAQIGKAG